MAVFITVQGQMIDSGNVPSIILNCIRGRISIVKATVVPDEDKKATGRENAFIITTPNADGTIDTYYLQADSKEVDK